MRGHTLTDRTFWWDRTGSGDAEVDPLRAVIFDLDAIADIESDGDLAPRSGLIDLVMSLFVAGAWIGVVSSMSRADAEPLVRELIGDGLVETIVTADDAESTNRTDLYELALWEFGIEPEEALAVVGSSAGLHAASATGLAAVRVSTDYIADDDVSTAAGCRRRHRRWWTARKRVAA
jgi:beta-phosphoglucomutase-like phosphatase (HAD superfamily)